MGLEPAGDGRLGQVMLVERATGKDDTPER